MTLMAEHLRDLTESSGLSLETMGAAGLRSLTAEEVEAVVGMEAGPGLGIPYQEASFRDGQPYLRVRLDRPFRTRDGDTARYLTRKGEAPRLYVPPTMPEGWERDTGRTLLITEGEKKALKATQEGFPCLAIPGVWGWLEKGSRLTSLPMEDFERIEWVGREVSIVGDSDLRGNRQAAAGLRRLGQELASRGARVRLVLLPEGDTGRG